MKVGILTFHDADNHGAVLQAYALQETIKRAITSNVEIIDYKQPEIVKSYKVFNLRTDNLKSLVRSIISNSLHLGIKVSKKKRFASFRKMHLHISPDRYDKPEKISELGAYDAYVVGSDQVWNPEITKYDATYFLNFCRKDAGKISYAASFGKDVLSAEEEAFARKYINHFDWISVREDSAAEILNRMLGKKSVQVLDPTLLLEPDRWMELAGSQYSGFPGMKDYLLVYRMSRNDEVLKVAARLSEKLGLDVLYLNDSIRRNKYGFKHIRGIGPIDFLNLMANASFIVTNSFHGTAFSIIFKKKFVSIPHETRGTRMASLLKLLKLEDRMISSAAQIADGFDAEIDYALPLSLLEAEKQKSIRFLRDALMNEQGADFHEQD